MKLNLLLLPPLLQDGWTRTSVTRSLLYDSIRIVIHHDVVEVAYISEPDEAVDANLERVDEHDRLAGVFDKRSLNLTGVWALGHEPLCRRKGIGTQESLVDKELVDKLHGEWTPTIPMARPQGTAKHDN